MRCSSFKNVAVFAALISACSPLVSFSPRVGVCTQRAAGCPFDVITARPAREFQIVGVIDIEAMHVRKIPNDEASFRRLIGAAVCKAGGDAVIPGVNRDGRYVLATVVKWVGEGQKGPICPKPPPDAGRPDAGSGHDGGARDAQVPDAGPPAAAPATSLGGGRAQLPTMRGACTAQTSNRTRFSQVGATC